MINFLLHIPGASFCYLLSYLVGRRLVMIYLPDRAQQWSAKVDKQQLGFAAMQLAVLTVEKNNIYLGFLPWQRALPTNQHLHIDGQLIGVDIFDFDN